MMQQRVGLAPSPEAVAMASVTSCAVIAAFIEFIDKSTRRRQKRSTTAPHRANTPSFRHMRSRQSICGWEQLLEGAVEHIGSDGGGTPLTDIRRQAAPGGRALRVCKR